MIQEQLTLWQDPKQIILEKLSKPWFIPSSTNLLDQLVEFKKKKEPA